MQLTGQAWLTDAKTQRLFAAFGDVPLRFVGGCVRDAVIGREVGDVDCATPALPEHVITLLQTAKIKAVPTGLAHGTITAIIEGKPFEITTLRRDVACDGRHAEVEYTDDWQQDALRRDFTMNALYCDASGHITDYTGGIEAAKAGRIQFIGDAQARITEDGLRILRFFRFFATHGRGMPDGAALAACAKLKGMISTLSGERIQREMLKLLGAENPYPALEAMQSLSIDMSFRRGPESMPPLNTHRLEWIPTFAGMTRGVALLRLALMLPNDQAAQTIADRWKLSNHDRDLLLLLVSHSYAGWPQTDLDIIRIARQLAPEDYRLLLRRNGARLHVSENEVTAMLARLEEIKIPIFPVKGGDLIALGIASGKALGEALKRLEGEWEKSDYVLSKEDLLALI